MVSAKEREQRCASIRRHVLLYAKRNDLRELDKAMAELKILMDLAELAPAPPRTAFDFLTAVIPDLTDDEIDRFIKAIEEGRE